MPYGSFFRWQLAKRGINLNTGRDQSLLRTRTIDDLVSGNYIEVAPDATLKDVESAMFAVKHYVAVIINSDKRFSGSLSTDEIFSAVAEFGRDEVCSKMANDVAHAVPISTSLLAALQTLNELDAHYAPVTRVGDEHTEVVGVIYRSDVLGALYELVRKARSEEYGVT